MLSFFINFCVWVLFVITLPFTCAKSYMFSSAGFIIKLVASMYFIDLL